MDSLDAASAAKLPQLLALRDALYSPEFRALVSEVTGEQRGRLASGCLGG